MLSIARYDEVSADHDPVGRAVQDLIFRDEHSSCRIYSIVLHYLYSGMNSSARIMTLSDALCKTHLFVLNVLLHDLCIIYIQVTGVNPTPQIMTFSDALCKTYLFVLKISNCVICVLPVCR